MEGEQVQGDGGDGQSYEVAEQIAEPSIDKTIVVYQSDEKALIGRQVKKADGTPGEVMDFDSESNLYKVRFGEDHTEDMSLEDVKGCLLPEITFKRFRQKRKEPTPEKSVRGDSRSEVSADELSESSEGEDTEHADEAGTTDGEPVTELTADETDQRETPPPPLENGNGVEDSDGEDLEIADGLDSDSSLDESDIEMLTRKRRKKKRKHVLTLQRWRGYRKKRKEAERNKLALVQVDNPDEAEKNQLMVDAMEEAAPRKRSRTRKLAEVDEIQRKRQKIASEFKNKLKASKADNAMTKSKETDDEQPGMVDGTPLPIQELMEPRPSPFDRGIKLRGRKLKKVFKGKVTRGEIADYCRRTRYYQVRYEDGEVEKLMWKDVKTMLVPFEQMQSWDDPDNDTLLSVYRETAKEKTIKLKPVSVKRR